MSDQELKTDIVILKEIYKRNKDKDVMSLEQLHKLANIIQSLELQYELRKTL